MRTIRFWDMDHTLIDNDCDVSWKSFMVEEGLAPEDALVEADRFFELYKEARLPIREFLEFQLAEFTGRTVDEMRELCERHFEWIVKPRLFADAERTVRAQHEAGDLLVVLTATNRYIAEPVARHLRIDHLLATELEEENGRFTGRFIEPYCGGIGKLHFADAFAARHGQKLADVWYYGDSTTDIPAMEGVGHPVAANPSPGLREVAIAKSWPIIDWRNHT